MPKKDLGNLEVYNESGSHSERIIVKTDTSGRITDMFRTPISDNPNKDHGHAWNLDKSINNSNPKDRPGRRDPQKYR